ncbi:hypothetical protein HZA57_03450 [Candidatus Poribacteria bacterium]|nr:hypothetical protein [Candidatus Poribacteria bacterium]
MNGMYKALLILLALCAAAAARAQTEPLDHYVQPSAWHAGLPFHPHAAQVDNGALHIARLADKLDTASSPLGFRGLAQDDAPTSPTAWTFASRELPPELRDGVLFAAAGKWLVHAPGAGEFAAFALDPQPGPPSPIILEAPFRRIDCITAGDGHLFVLGADGEDAQVAATALDALSPESRWAKGMPVPDQRRDAAIIVFAHQILVAGGWQDVEGETLNNQPTYKCEYTNLGRLSSWTYMPVHRLEFGLGAVSADNTHGLIGVIGDVSTTPLGDSSTSQTLTFTVSRPDGSLALWRTAILDAPALEGGIAAASPDAQQLLVLGGTDAKTGAPNKTVWGYQMPATNESTVAMRNKSGPAVPPGRRNDIELLDYKTAEKRAAVQHRPMAIIVLGDDAASEAVRRRLRDRTVRAMFDGLVAASPLPGERATVQQRIGIQAVPAFALLDADGKVAGAVEGFPEDASLFMMMEPVWQAPAPE